MHRAIHRWQGAKYSPGAQIPGAAADCRSFVLAVLTDLSGVSHDLEELPPDTALYQPQVARRFLRTVARLYSLEKVRDGVIRPGDVFVTRLPSGGPTHGMIAGNKPWVYHCVPRKGFSRKGIDVGMPIEAIYRLGR